MTVISKDEAGKIVLMCKGADNIMEPRISWEDGVQNQVKKQLFDFAVEGLRTLVMAQKELDLEEYTQLEI